MPDLSTLTDKEKTYRHLICGNHYTVIKEFTDYDRTLHPVGETWEFIRYRFLPHDNGLSLFISFDGANESQIRLSLYEEDQGPIAHYFESYIQPITAI